MVARAAIALAGVLAGAALQARDARAIPFINPCTFLDCSLGAQLCSAYDMGNGNIWLCYEPRGR
jgi:hypothetical protein